MVLAGARAVLAGARAGGTGASGVRSGCGSAPGYLAPIPLSINI